MPSKVPPPAATPLTPAGTSAVPVRARAGVADWLHPVCFAVFPLLALYVANIHDVPWRHAARPVMISVAATLALCALVAVLARSVRRATIFVSAALFLFFSDGHIRDFFASYRASGGAASARLLGDLSAYFAAHPVRAHFETCGVLLAVLIGVGWAVFRTRRDLAAVATLLNIVGLALIAPSAFTVANAAVRHQGLQGAAFNGSEDPLGDSLKAAQAHPETIGATPTPASPDIYYIILDGYGREDVLRKFYGFDNSSFTRALQQRGFYVATKARPNYGRTIMSIASSLNMRYLDDVANRVGPAYHDWTPLREMVNRPAVADFLRPRGYKFVAVSTGYPDVHPSGADLLLGDEGVNEKTPFTQFDGAVIAATPLSLLPMRDMHLYAQRRYQLDLALKDLGRTPQLPYRKFVFAHILAPHPPFVFGPDGEPTQPANRLFDYGDGSDFMDKGGTKAEYFKGYIDQLRYMNTRVLSALDAIRAQSKTPPIILIQGDHGPRMLVDWSGPERTDLRETYGNLNAFSLPDGKAATVFYDGITPVNSFRLLFHHQFGADLPQLPDRNYFTTTAQLYGCIDVTDRIPPTVDDPLPSAPQSSPKPTATPSR